MEIIISRWKRHLYFNSIKWRRILLGLSNYYYLRNDTFCYKFMVLYSGRRIWIFLCLGGGSLGGR